MVDRVVGQVVRIEGIDHAGHIIQKFLSRLQILAGIDDLGIEIVLYRTFGRGFPGLQYQFNVFPLGVDYYFGIRVGNNIVLGRVADNYCAKRRVLSARILEQPVDMVSDGVIGFGVSVFDRIDRRLARVLIGGLGVLDAALCVGNGGLR